MDVVIAHAETPESIRRCFSVMVQLRPHLREENFVERVHQQEQAHGFRLVSLEADAIVRAVAGYHLSQCLAWGKFLYVEDLITTENDRGQGFGLALFDWLVARARDAGCEQFHLDSGVQRFAAHRFYLSRGMQISSHHFSMTLR